MVVAADGLSSECEVLTNYRIGFLLGKNNYVGVMDPNHSMKSFRSQLAVGKNIVSQGCGIFDVGLFSGIVNSDVVRIRDFAASSWIAMMTSITLQSWYSYCLVFIDYYRNKKTVKNGIL